LPHRSRRKLIPSERLDEFFHLRLLRVLQLDKIFNLEASIALELSPIFMASD
jgi:hypothetical protein